MPFDRPPRAAIAHLRPTDKRLPAQRPISAVPARPTTRRLTHKPHTSVAAPVHPRAPLSLADASTEPDTRKARARKSAPLAIDRSCIGTGPLRSRLSHPATRLVLYARWTSRHGSSEGCFFDD